MNLRSDKIVCGVPFLLAVLTMQMHMSGAVLQVVVPQEIESVNGSNDTMGCTSPLVDSGDGVMVCSSGCSTLLDGISPTIDTSASDWASQLVTVRKTVHNIAPYSRVLLTFGFDTAVTVTRIELDLFLCPKWNIGALEIIVYANTESNLTFSNDLPSQTNSILSESSKSSCDSLSTVNIMIPQPLTGSSFLTWHILMSQFGDDAEWAHIGEVRFLDADIDPNPGLCNGSVGIPTTPPAPTTSDTSTSTMSESPTHHTMYRSDSTQTTTTSSTHTMTVPTSPSSSGSSSPIVFIAIGVVVVIMVLALLVVVFIIIIVCKKRRNSQEELKKLQDVTCEPGGMELKSKSVENDEYRADNPLYAQQSPSSNGHQPPPATVCPMYDTADGAVDNQHYYTSPDKPGTVTLDDSLYSVVDNEKRTTLKAAHASTQNTAPTLNTAPPEESSPVYSMVDKDTKKKLPELVTDAIYSDVHKEPSPAVPPKSPDLQTYLSTKDVMARPVAANPPSQPLKVSTLPVSLAGGMSDNPNYESADALSSCSHNSNEVESAMYAQPYFHRNTASTHDSNTIYSEPLQPSDFTHVSKQQPEQTEEVEDLRMYSSIYTVATSGNDTFHQTVEITSDNISELRELGTGQFGKVVLAQTYNLSLKDMRMSERDDNRNISIYVAVKKLRSNPTSTQREAFDKEIKFMSRLNHPNVVLFLGVCYREPSFIIMEYMEKGDLSQFLQQYSDIVPTPSDGSQLATSIVVHMATQIASGMMYLASKNFVHRDLASRNCLVGDRFIVKLADFGMSRNLYESHYYRIHGNAVLPIRWMSTECFYGMFSEKTDAWAFGITMWELFTLAKDKPYPDLNDSQVVEDAVNRGSHRKIHPRPSACPQPVYEVMLQCWAINPKERATFQVLHEMLQKLPQDF